MAFPVPEEQIIAAESALGRRLAQPHRARLMHDNGGEITANGTVWWLFPVWDPANRRTIKRTTNHIIKENETAKERYGFPANAIAIAADGCGNSLIYREASDQILRWDHETRECQPAEVDWD